MVCIQRCHFNAKVANELGNEFNAMICHVKAIAIREGVRGDFELFDCFTTDNVHLSTFVKHKV